MIRHTRGESVTFTNTFYDVDGIVTIPDSVAVTVIYPSSSPPGNLLARDPGQLKGKETLAMTVDGDGLWTAVWDSSISDPGVVYWNMRSSGTGANSEDGMFVVEGNLANVEAF